MPWTNRTQATVNGVTTSYSWDARNRLTEATTPNGSLLFGYDINGIRTSRSENGITANFVVDHNQQYAQVLAEIENGFTAKQYTYGDDLLSQTDGARQERFFLYDGLGTTRALADGAEAVTDTYAYEAFGQLLATTGSSDNAYRYTGEQYDSGLDQYYLRARYYDQGVGRFTSMDTWMGINTQPITLNKYLYANADPVNYTDPSGHFGISGAIHAVSVLGSLVTAATVGFETGSIINRSARTGDVLSTANAKSAAGIALSIIPLKYLTKVADLSDIAAKLERAGFASVILDTNKSVKGFNKVFHWVQRLHQRGFTAEQALKALSQGKTWIDTKSGAVVKVLGNAKENGTIKILLVDGKITTVLSDKLGKKFVPFSPIDR